MADGPVWGEPQSRRPVPDAMAERQTMMRAAHDEGLQHLFDPLVPRPAEVRHRTLSLAGAAERSSDDHGAITAVIASRDTVAARRAVLRHTGTLYDEVPAAHPAAERDPWHVSALSTATSRTQEETA